MLRVRDIMTPEVVTLSPDASLSEAIETLVTCRIGGAPVLDGGKVVGVLSATDVMEFEAEKRPLHGELEGNGRAVLEPAEEWEEGTDSPARFFTDPWDTDEAGMIELPTASPRWSLLSEYTVAEAMTRSVCTLPAKLEVSAASQRMLAAGVQRALVTEDGNLVGIVTTTDIMRAVAERRLSVRQFVFERRSGGRPEVTG